MHLASHPATDARPLARRLLRNLVCALAASAASAAFALQGVVFDGSGNHQLYLLPGKTAHSGNLTTYSSQDRLYDGADGNSATTMQGPAGYWLEFDLTPPQTVGTVSQRLKVVRVSFNNSGYQVKIQVKNGASGSWSDWGSPITADTLIPGYQDITGPATTFTHLRIVRLASGYMNIREIDFWGDIQQDAAASTFRAAGVQATPDMLDHQKNRLANGTHPSGLTLSALNSAYPAAPYTGAYYTTITENTGGTTDAGGAAFANDSQRILRDALAWWFTGNNTHAANVVGMLEGWEHPNFTYNGQELAPALWAGSFIAAADILRAGGYSGFTPDLQGRFETWVHDRILPRITRSCFSNVGGTQGWAHFNWSTISRRTFGAYAIYTKNRYLLNVLTEFTLEHMKIDSNSFGEVNETTRDVTHAAMLYGGWIALAEMERLQGSTRIYDFAQSGDSSTANGAPGTGYRLANALEYHMKVYSVGGCAITPPPTAAWGWPFSSGDCLSFESGTVVPADNGDGKFHAWGPETAFNYYKNIKGRSLPYSSARASWMSGRSNFNERIDGHYHSFAWGTLTHRGLGSNGLGPSQLVPVAVTSYTSQQSGNEATNLYDDDVGDNTGARWAAGSGSYPQSIVLDLGSARSIGRFDVYPYSNRGYTYTLGVSNSPGSGFTQVVNRSGGGGAEVFTHNVSASGRYVRLTVTGGSSGWASICELDIFGQ
jgi:hypothetical protein